MRPGGATTDDEIAGLKARIKDLEAVLNQNNIELAVAFKLPQVICNLMGILMAVHIVTPETLQRRLDVVDPKLSIHRLRAALEPWRARLGLSGDDKIIHSRRQYGYWIEPEIKIKLREIIAGVNIEDAAEVTTEVRQAA